MARMGRDATRTAPASARPAPTGLTPVSQLERPSSLSGPTVGRRVLADTTLVPRVKGPILSVRTVLGSGAASLHYRDSELEQADLGRRAQELVRRLREDTR
jgi:hypothetical protein